MKVHILYKFVEGPSGGGNQFLKGLKDYLSSKKRYITDSSNTDVILFNSMNYTNKELKILYKLRSKRKILVHRVDGPISRYRGKNLQVDKEVYLLNQFLADATIFQSNWSRQENYKLGMKPNKFEKVIINAPDSRIFNRKGKSPFSKNRKIRLIATSWSSNWNKGFETYKWLDENLDFSKYEMTFIGNSPIEFKNIKHILPLKSEDLAKELKKSDIYITASKKDPCSNSLIEALHCGLPAIGLRDGGHPEIIKNGGELFDALKEIPPLLTKIIKKYKKYQKKIDIPSMKEVGERYYRFMQEIYEKYKNGVYKPKTISKTKAIKLQCSLFKMRIVEKIKRYISTKNVKLKKK